MRNNTITTVGDIDLIVPTRPDPTPITVASEQFTSISVRDADLFSPEPAQLTIRTSVGEIEFAVTVPLTAIVTALSPHPTTPNDFGGDR